MEQFRSGAGLASANIAKIASHIQPSVAQVVGPDERVEEQPEWAGKITRANVLNSMNRLLEGHVIGELAGNGQVEVVGAEFCLATGAVDFFAGPLIQENQEKES